MRGNFSPRARQGLALISCSAAIAGGVAAAVAASGAAERQARGSITIVGTIPGEPFGLTIQGTSFGDQGVVERAQGAGLITISGSDLVNERTDCEGGGTMPVTCPARAIQEIRASLGDGKDALSFVGSGLQSLTIVGITGDGNDSITGARGPESLNGGKGRDDLGGGAGDDVLRGGPDPDTIDGGPGRDTCDARDDQAEPQRCEN